MSSMSSRVLLVVLVLLCGIALFHLPVCYSPAFVQQQKESVNTLAATTQQQQQQTEFSTTSSFNPASLPRTVLPFRLAQSVDLVRMILTNSILYLSCPKNQELGDPRPAHQSLQDIGSLCEPWQNRKLIQVLWHYLDATMLGLEWSSGSGTLWALRRGLTLHSVEHCKPWLDMIATKVEMLHSAFGNQTEWFPHHVARADGKGCEQTLANHWDTMEEIFGEYKRYPREHLFQTYAPKGFDIVSVDGRFRDGCLLEAIDLVNPEYGLVLLDNAERAEYTKPSQIPSHWLVVSFSNNARSKDETAIWMACPSKDDEHCTQARIQIVSKMATLPSVLVGRRYTEHMRRAREDGVPGA